MVNIVVQYIKADHSSVNIVDYSILKDGRQSLRLHLR